MYLQHAVSIEYIQFPFVMYFPCYLESIFDVLNISILHLCFGFYSIIKLLQAQWIDSKVSFFTNHDKW